MNPSPRAEETIGIFGGAFDPPHVGHVLAAHYVMLTTPISRVLVVPCANHPFGKDLTDFEHRLAMCRLAFGEAAGVEVLDIEGGGDGANFTIDTVRRLTAEHPDARFELIVGSDNLRDFDKWKDADDLRRLTRLRVLPRFEENESAAAKSNAAGLPSFHLPRLSSTTARRVLREENGRERLAPHVPRAVLDYIERHGLYVDAYK